VSSTGQCLVNPPVTPLNYSIYLPGQFYTTDQQCKLLYGPGSSYSTCSVSIVFVLTILNT
jgi:hypothetical protein